MPARALLAAALVACAALPGAAGAQVIGPGSVGEALRQMERLHAAHAAVRGHRGELAQTWVLPERPGQNAVVWYDFNWQVEDVPSPSGGDGGGLRLYWYGREREVVERALPVIRNAYLRLVEVFHYTPSRRIPYILYASAREFQTTNVFEVSEAVLGVTSPRDLKMSLAWFGDPELFREVSTHELVHEFTIQKLLDLADGDPAGLESLPLWFVEGIAEWYAKGGLDPESDLYVRDLVWNPDPERGYEVLPFAEDGVRGYIPTYKLGQARIEFIAETYGAERIQGFIENAPLHAGFRGFESLVERVLGEPLPAVDVRWRAWLRQRYYPAWLAVRQDLAQTIEVRDAPAEIEAFVASPDGATLLVRGIDRSAGRARLYLLDPRHPGDAVELAADDEPGVESLHPIERSVLALGKDLLVFSAQDGPGDALYAQPYAVVPGRKEEPGSKETPGVKAEPPHFTLGDRRRIPVRHPAGRAFLEISSPALSPDERSIAFVGLTDLGQPDVYVVPVEGGVARQLTDDAYAERDLAWGEGGIYLASDATDHGRWNLFRLDPATGARTQLTTGPTNDRQPRPLGDGGLLFASDAGGQPDLYLLRDGRVRRLTEFATGLGAPALAPGARGIWASTFHGGLFRLVEVPRESWLSEPERTVAAAEAGPAPVPREPMPAPSQTYDPFHWGQWRPEAAIVYGGAATGAFAGRAAVLFADVLRDRLAYVDLAVVDSFDRTQALLLYQNRAGRRPWSLGVYHFVTSTVDVTNTDLSYFQRDFGAVGTLAFPLDRFRRFEVDLSAGGVQRYCLTDFSVDQPIECGGGPLTDALGSAWQRLNGGVNFQAGPAVRFGYDTVRLHPISGPESGTALVLELGGSVLPGRSAVTGYGRFDAQRYWRLFPRARVELRLAGAASFGANEAGRAWERTWWVSAADNLRGYGPLDLAYIVGTRFWVANLELQLPIDPVIHIPFVGLQGVAALDFGGVSSRGSSVAGADPRDPARPPSDFGWWDARTLTGVLGFDVIFGPLLFRVSFGHPFDIGGIRTPALRSGDRWVTNFTLRYLFF